jgi:sugar lactone lactonase YvrE
MRPGVGVSVRGGLGLLLVVSLAAAWLAPAALAADSVYWSEGGPSAPIRVGNLSGGAASDLFTGENTPQGVAIDAAAGKIYWATEFGDIRVANLDGSGAATSLFSGENIPAGVAIDPAAGKLYWADTGSGAIRVGSVSGGTASDLFTGESQPHGVAIDTAAGKIYWTDTFSGKIRVGNLSGGSASDMFTGQNDPFGIAVDSVSGKIYWSDLGSGKIRVANITGGGLPADLFTNEGNPTGVAVDHAAGKLYWTTGSTGKIRVGSLTGGIASDLFSGESSSTGWLALLRSPAGVGAPLVSGGSSVNSLLSCSQGSWAPDPLEALLYRAPASFAYQWSLNGADILGATSSSYGTTAPGTYSCRVTATNQAGSDSQTSAPFAVTGAGAPPPSIALKLTNVSQSHRRWRRGNAAPHIASLRAPVGTRFRFALNEPAQVRFVFKQLLPGRRAGGRCVAPTLTNLSKPKCTRAVTRGTLSFAAGAGAYNVRFQGRLSKHKRLPIGRYALAIAATNAAGQRVTARLTFTVAT